MIHYFTHCLLEMLQLEYMQVFHITYVLVHDGCQSDITCKYKMHVMVVVCELYVSP
jgi:hypothetical protein